jgi:hypothetical protein
MGLTKFAVRAVLGVLLGVTLLSLIVLISPHLSFSGYDKEKANQRLRLEAGNLNYQRELEAQLAIEHDPAQIEVLQAELKRIRH